MHFAQQPRERVLGDETQMLIAREPVGTRVDARELRVVVQHLLECGTCQRPSVEYRAKPPPTWS
jgi:hypothetical protein